MYEATPQNLQDLVKQCFQLYDLQNKLRVDYERTTVKKSKIPILQQSILSFHKELHWVSEDEGSKSWE